jgi:hypothetical protein
MACSKDETRGDQHAATLACPVEPSHSDDWRVEIGEIDLAIQHSDVFVRGYELRGAILDQGRFRGLRGR